MNLDDLYPGRFLKAGNLQGRKVTVEIERVFHNDLGKPPHGQDRRTEAKKAEETKVVMTFKGAKKALVLAKINATCCAEMFGRDADAWIGKSVVLYGTNKIMPFPRQRGDTRPPEDCIRIFGSPHITQPISFEFKKRQGSVRMTMQPTGKREAPAVNTDAKCDPAKWRKKLRAQAGECFKKGGGGEDADAYYHAALRVALGAFKEDDVHLADMTDEQALRASQVMGDHVQGVEPLL